MRPKKRREIEGVSSSSIIDLKASLFQAEEEVKRAKASGKPLPAKQLVVKQPQTRNKGVEERAQRDQIALEQQLNPTESLNSKMQQYNAMISQGYMDSKEQFLVDFEQKKWDEASSSTVGLASSIDVTPEAVVQEHVGESEAGDVLSELSEQTRSAGARADELRKRRLEAAKKRMQLKKASS
uniref:Uncharacterized protein n=1 Tax=Hanusia phi TaxID=3032 RepID=A0A7S0HFG6_9CRYP